MKPLIIALGHQSRVGKDTAARAIVRSLEAVGGVVQVAFAAKLKATCYDLFGIYGLRSAAFYENPAQAHMRYECLPELGLSPVDIWIKVGQAMRAIYAPIWVDQALRSAVSHDAFLVVISDLRFPNEARAVRARGGICVKVERPDNPVPPQGSDTAFGPDFEWDALLTNDRGLETLESRACALARDYLARRLKERR